MAGFSVLILLLLMVVVLSAFNGRKRKMGPPDNGVK
jgi:hypothetical protein